MVGNVNGTSSSPPAPGEDRGGDVQTIELLEEVLRVAKRTVETGRVRVSIATDTEQRTVRESLASRHVLVERVPVGRRLAAGEQMPQSRTEGEVLIIPMVEEVLVVEKRLVVTEELHVRVVREQHEVEQVVPLRRQTATVEHLAPLDEAAS